MGFDYLKNVSVAILSCNRREDLRQTLDTLQSCPTRWKEIVVADNASTDGTVQMLRESYPDVRVLALASNDGVAGLNRALLSCTGEWVLSLDDDSCPVVETWEGLAKELSSGVRYDTITCSVRRSRSEVDDQCGSGIVSDYLGLHQAGSLIRHSVLNSLNGYDESLFLWGVELDFSARALVCGYRMGKCDGAIVEHRSTPTNRSSKRHAYFYTRNLLVFLKRYAPAELKRTLIAEYLSNVILFSLLHRTNVYWKGARAASTIEVPCGTGLSTDQFNRMGPDLRLPFTFLG